MLRRTCSSPATFASARCQLRRWNFPLLQPLAVSSPLSLFDPFWRRCVMRLCVHVASTSLSISPPPPDAATVRFLTSLGACTQVTQREGPPQSPHKVALVFASRPRHIAGCWLPYSQIGSCRRGEWRLLSNSCQTSGCCSETFMKLVVESRVSHRPSTNDAGTPS